MQVLNEIKKNILLISDKRTEEILKLEMGFIKKYFAINIIIFVGLFSIVGIVVQGIGLISTMIIAIFLLVNIVLQTIILAWILNRIFKKEDRTLGDALKTIIVGRTPYYLFGWIPVVNAIVGLIAFANEVLLFAKAYRENAIKVAIVSLVIQVIMIFIVTFLIFPLILIMSGLPQIG